ncbi:hypothetical protein [Nocardia xishanensis]|uniref:hypothetical protein n=1 Tax=Nocardia xishanensis TaxID=238964 RepID=UPI0008346A73|nr:hypothetical protein [Nocardia xishanensis]
MTGDEKDIVSVVESLHADLAAWLGSAAPPEVFERFAEAQHERFSMVAMCGAVLGRDELLTGLREARNTEPGLRIEVAEITELAREGDLVVVRFLERHLSDDGPSSRWVSAVLCAVEDSGSGYRWLSVHETAVDE